MKAYWGRRGIGPLIHNVNTKWRKPLHRKLGGSQNRSGPSTGEKNPFTPPGIEAQTIQPAGVTISITLNWVPKFMYSGESLWSHSVICKGQSHKILHIDINSYIHNFSFKDNLTDDYTRY